MIPFPLLVALSCPAGLWDFGPQAALLYVRCEESPSISFCNRRAFLAKGICTGEAQRIRCEAGDPLVCREDRFEARIHAVSEREIRYDFKSSFNEGSLQGTPVEVN